MNSSCRICRRNELKEFFSLNYQSDFHSETGETILEMLNFITGLNASLGDHLPQQLCRLCTGTLVAGYELRNLCIESDTFLRQNLQSDHEKEADQTDHNDLESCLTLGQVKLEPSLEQQDTGIEFVERDLEYNVERSADRFYCCFPNCRVNYQFEELLTEHAESDHQLEKEANASNSSDSEFRCIVCARGFTDEIDLLQHRNREKATLQSNSNSTLEKAANVPNRKTKLCSCGFKSNQPLTFKHHQTTCAQSQLYANRSDKIPDADDTDKTNDELIAMGFSLNRNTTMFYCCISQCPTVCETHQQLCDHFQQLHSKVREENMQGNSSTTDVYRCTICYIDFPTEKKLQIHLEDAYHPTFRCNTCRYHSPSRTKAIMHAMVPCGSNRHRCSCGYATPYTSAIKRHVRRTGCSIEGGSLRNYKIRSRPVRDATSNDMPFKCTNCQTCFRSIANLRRHTESELTRALAKQEAADPGKQVEGSERKQYTCCWCKTITDDSHHLVRCMVKAEKNTGEYMGYKCSICDRKFKKYNQYLEHSNNKVCLQKSVLACKPCGVKFPTRKKLAKHMANMHNMNKPKRVPRVVQIHECKDCKSQFVTAYTLNRHRKRLHNVEETSDETSETMVI